MFLWCPKMIEASKSVLVVDDDESVRRSLSKILERAGYKVAAAGTGQEALEMVRANRFDVILIDIKLPDVSGTELLSKLPKNRETVKIVITGYSTVEHGAQAADYGADDFLVKPVQPQELLRTIAARLAKL